MSVVRGVSEGERRGALASGVGEEGTCTSALLLPPPRGKERARWRREWWMSDGDEGRWRDAVVVDGSRAAVRSSSGRLNLMVERFCE